MNGKAEINPVYIGEKPPLGIKPRYIHNKDRCTDLMRCILRYWEVVHEPDTLVEHCEELVDLLNIEIDRLREQDKYKYGNHSK